MVDALLVRVGELLPACLVDTFGCHFVKFVGPGMIVRGKKWRILEPELSPGQRFSSGCFKPHQSRPDRV